MGGPNHLICTFVWLITTHAEGSKLCKQNFTSGLKVNELLRNIVALTCRGFERLPGSNSALVKSDFPVRFIFIRIGVL